MKKGGDVYEGIEKSLLKPMGVNPAANAAEGFSQGLKRIVT